MGYTIKVMTVKEVVEDIDLIIYFRKVGEDVANQYGNKFDWKNFNLYKYVANHRLVLCRKDGRPVGVMLCRLTRSAFDPSVRILRQDLLYAKKGSRAARLLLLDFIDFGKANADHIITMIGQHTNIKPRSLNKLGFNKLEEIYRFEV